MNRLGFWTLTLLLATLAPTPIQIVTGWKWPLRLRRMLGLEAFLYVCLHFAVYLGVDQFFDWSAIGKDIVKRQFITVGFAAFVLLIPLAITSTDGMVRRLGFVRWKRLHRLIYVVGGPGRRALRLAGEVRPAATVDLRGCAGGAAGHSLAAVGSRDASGAAVDVTTSRVMAVGRGPRSAACQKISYLTAPYNRAPRGAAR